MQPPVSLPRREGIMCLLWNVFTQGWECGSYKGPDYARVAGKQQQQSCWDPSVGWEGRASGWGAKWQGNKAETGQNINTATAKKAVSVRAGSGSISEALKWVRLGPGGLEYSWDYRRLQAKRGFKFHQSQRTSVNREVKMPSSAKWIQSRPWHSEV